MNASDYLDQLRKDLAANPGTLKEAKKRLDDVFEAAKTFKGTLRVYCSGSVASGFTNDPVSDADGGVVLDRRSFPNLGPDGGGDPPTQVFADIQTHTRPLLKKIYPDVVVARSKRGLLVKFNESLASGEDPTVDLVVALSRKKDNALWIPNLDQDRWDPGHPERHVELFTTGTPSLCTTRRHVVRIAKAQVKQFKKPAVCSFNIAALAWECIKKGEAIDAALYRFFGYAASELGKHLTADPANVSPAIKVEDRSEAARRFRVVAESIESAIDAGDDDDKVREALSANEVFWNFINPPAGTSSSAIQNKIASNSAIAITPDGTLSTSPSPKSKLVKPTRPYGSSTRPTV